jgi:septal ring factor EnvC (AmiA/AmiB activator)
MPVKAMKVPVRAKRSKVEMQQEFAEIQEQVESAREAADAKAEGAARLRAAEVRQAAESITVEAVVQKISGLSKQRIGRRGSREASIPDLPTDLS